MSSQEQTQQIKPDSTINTPNSANGEIFRIEKAVWLAGIGILLTLVLILILLAFGWTAGSDLVAVVGVFTSLVGTLVGYIIGGSTGSQGKESAEKRASAAQDNAMTAEKKAAKANAFSVIVKAKLTKHQEHVAKGLATDSALLQDDLRELADLSDKLLE